MMPREARAAALRTFGNPTLLREQSRASWSWNGLESILRDQRFAFRALRRTPAFMVLAVLVMALSIGANVALFTVVRGVILKPLPFKDPNRLVMLYESRSRRRCVRVSTPSPGESTQEWKKQNHTFSNLALVQRGASASRAGGQLPEKLYNARTSPGICCQHSACSQR